jgi:hypothetical protein
MKTPLYRLCGAITAAAALQTASADVLLTDNFQVSSNTQNVSQELATRQTGPLAPAYYTGWHVHHQVGNNSTDVGQPGGIANSNFVLLAFDGSFFSDLNIATIAAGPLTIEFDLYLRGANPGGASDDTWVACSLRSAGDMFPVAGSGEFGFLVRARGGVQAFQNGGSIAPGEWDTAGVAMADHWTLVFSDSAGTGSAFNGNGSQVTMINGTTTLGTLSLSQLNSAGLRLGFRDVGNRFGGVSNLKISGTPGNVAPAGYNASFEQDQTLPGTSVPFTPTGWTGFNQQGNGDFGSQTPGGADFSVIAPLAPPADSNQFCYINVFNGTSVGGIYQDRGPLKSNSIYTLTVAIGSRKDRVNSPGIISLVNGADNTGTVLAAGGGLPGTQDAWQDYTATFTTGPSVSGDLTIVLSVLGASTIQADFDNVRLDIQQLSVPPPFLVHDTAPSSSVAVLGSNAVFTAAFSNVPPVTLQWQQIVSGSPTVTNNINTGVVTVTNSGVVTSTLTLNNVQLSGAGAYRLRAVNATGVAVYTTAASLTVVPPITWHAAGTYNSPFADNSVLALAGTPANEVYGVDFGGSGQLTTDNGYSFDDYATTGNMSVASAGLGTFGGYLGGATTGDGNFDLILNNGIYGGAAGTGTLNNLTVGQTYTVLVMLADTRSSGAGGSTFHVTDGATVSPAQRYAYANGQPKVGGYIMGTFTAQATTQPLTVLLDTGGSQYSAILLEKGIAPAPAIPPTLPTDIRPLMSRVATGAPLSLTVVANGSLPLSYQWYNQGGALTSVTNSSYTFNALSGTNSYQVVVTNAYGAATSSVAVVVGGANIVTVNNFSFEDGATSGPGGGTLPVAWTQAGSINWCLVASGTYDTLPEGSNFFALNEGPSDSTGGICQDVGPLLANTTYTLTVALGHHPGFRNSPGIISLLNGTNYTGTLLASASGIPDAGGTWQDYSVSYTTGDTVSGHLTVALTVAPASTWQGHFDNVRLTKATAPDVVPPSQTTDIRPLRSEVTTGTPMSFTFAANGKPMNYQWFTQNGPIQNATNASYAFNAVAGTNSYYVTVTNSAGAITSSTAVVISSASIITISNFSFEDGSAPAFGNGAIPVAWTDYNSDWSTVSGDTSHFDPAVIPDGTHYYARNTGPSATTGGVYQDVGALLPNTTYKLTVAIGRRNDQGPGPSPGDWSPGIISLLNGTDYFGTQLASTTGYPDVAGAWQDFSATFTTGASVHGDLTITLAVPPASTYQAAFDHVRLTKAPIVRLNVVSVQDGNLILTASNGEAGKGYALLTTTNLSAPIVWTTNSTGTLDAAGALSNAIPLETAPARFFRLRVD